MKKIKETSIYLLILMSIILIGTTLLFICKVSLTRFHLPIFIIITTVFYYLLRKKNSISDIIKVVVISLLIVVASTLISSFMYDRSSDGNTYHKDAVGVLKEGFNPVYESSKDFIEKRNDPSSTLTEYSIWTDHYAKANWIIASNFYSLTNNIESGKAMNLISMYIVFGFMFTSISLVLDKKRSFILALLITINPITASQMFTYYNDQLVCMYLFLSILFLIKLDYNLADKETWLFYILTFIILANMKFNGLGYLLVFSFLFVCRYLYKSYKNKEFLKILKKLVIIYIPTFVISLLIVGYPTYIKNTIEHSNPFFPLYDKNGEDIITAQQPQKFLKMNNLEKLFYGTFSKANNLRENDNTDLKIPFTIYKSELTSACSNDLRISGWGVLFSGLLLCSIIILIKYYKEYKKDSWILYTLAITVILMIAMSESWWARYTPHFYLFIILSVYILLKYNKHKLINIVYLSIIIINTLIPLVGNSYYTLKNSIKITKDLGNLKGKEILVNINDMNGVIYNLKDNDIKYVLNEENNGSELYYHYLSYQECKEGVKCENRTNNYSLQ